MHLRHKGRGAPGDAEKDVRPGIAARRKGSGTAQSAMAGVRGCQRAKSSGAGERKNTAIPGP